MVRIARFNTICPALLFENTPWQCPVTTNPRQPQHFNRSWNLPASWRVLSERSQRRCCRFEGWRRKPIYKSSIWKWSYLDSLKTNTSTSHKQTWNWLTLYAPCGCLGCFSTLYSILYWKYSQAEKNMVLDHCQWPVFPEPGWGLRPFSGPTWVIFPQQPAKEANWHLCGGYTWEQAVTENGC